MATNEKRDAMDTVGTMFEHVDSDGDRVFVEPANSRPGLYMEMDSVCYGVWLEPPAVRELHAALGEWLDEDDAPR